MITNIVLLLYDIKVRHYLDAIGLGLGPLLGQICRTRTLRQDQIGGEKLAWDNIDFQYKPKVNLIKILKKRRYLIIIRDISEFEMNYHSLIGMIDYVL